MITHLDKCTAEPNQLLNYNTGHSACPLGCVCSAGFRRWQYRSPELPAKSSWTGQTFWKSICWIKKEKWTSDTPVQIFRDDRSGSLTLKQMFLLLMGVQPNSQLKGGVVGGTVVTCTPSAGFLHMYFSLLLQLTTSHSPAKTPVVIATHPWFLSFYKAHQCKWI